MHKEYRPIGPICLVLTHTECNPASINMWPYITGANQTAPRTELQLDQNVLLMKLPLKKLNSTSASAQRQRQSTGSVQAGVEAETGDDYGYFKLFATFLPSSNQAPTQFACWGG